MKTGHILSLFHFFFFQVKKIRHKRSLYNIQEQHCEWSNSGSVMLNSIEIFKENLSDNVEKPKL